MQSGCTSCGPDPNNSQNPLIREYGSLYEYAPPRFAPGIRKQAGVPGGDVGVCHLGAPIRNFYSAGDDLTSERRAPGPGQGAPGYGCPATDGGMRTPSMAANVYSNIMYDNMPGSDMKTVESFTTGNKTMDTFVKLAVVALIIYLIMHYMKKGNQFVQV